ncbi:hypothetical protein ACQKKX_04105 [Neorhizobium sp. NPDC001467]|uniref:hypothetical protein n=1 Tax=Neorhizobium sp. NPDC001467 TaxID=3390595 RepID=UPI003D032A91
MTIILISLRTRCQTRVKLPLISRNARSFWTVSKNKNPAILVYMQDQAPSIRLPLILAGSILATGLLILSVLGWLQYGSEIFRVMAENGMSWCA